MLQTNVAFWISFFVEAGIPPAAAANYAIIFTDNRIQKHMLLDLNKEYLKDMGVNVLGDIIAILKHSKRYHEKVIFLILTEKFSSINSYCFFFRLQEKKFLLLTKKLQ